ncbi:MAG: MFS transporter [Pseudonocardiaceae bacterium]
MLLGERPRPRGVREHPQAGWLAVGTVCLGAFMGQLDASIVTLTFPTLQGQFQAPLAAVQWVSLAYLLTLAGLLVAVGQVADAVGRKLMYLHGFALFTVASVACGLAPGLAWLVIFRIVQAVGAAMLQANSVALVVTSVPRSRMRAGLGVQAAAQALGLALGPTVGGLLVASLGWRWVFWVNVPVGCLAWVAGRYLLPRTRERTPVRRFDVAGLLLLALATTTLLLAVSAVSGLPMPGWSAAVLLVVSVLAVVGFVARERHATSPLVDLSVLRPPAVSAGLAGALCGYLVLFGPLALFPQVLGAHGAAGVRTGLILTALPAGFAVAAVTAERVLPARWGPRARSLTGAGMSLAAAAALIAVPTSVGWVVGLLGLLGLGLGIFIPANNGSIMAAILARMAAIGGGLVSMSRSLGTALGIALVTLCLHAAEGMGSGWAGARLALAMLALVALAAGASSLAAGHPVPTPRAGEQQP